ncbi:hypothetical protein EJP67_02325 [Variovorax guangxiensis]|uniref:Uncharacterized protein n=1 Tax=Variovorax guangxiensis TaxID=1775474 RepID=A0A3S0X6K8_9BURK|nr:hypothetical protein [Variovorax guangxiensis]RUR65890.1 hypothetical protein EJP67_02325 [Variovorax guangxiensis]
MTNDPSQPTSDQGLPLSLKGAAFERHDAIRSGIARMIAEHRRGNFSEDGSINVGRLIANIGFQVYDREVRAILTEIRAETSKVCSPS